MTKGTWKEVIARALLIMNTFVIEYIAWQGGEITDGYFMHLRGSSEPFILWGISGRVIWNL